MCGSLFLELVFSTILMANFTAFKFSPDSASQREIFPERAFCSVRSWHGHKLYDKGVVVVVQKRINNVSLTF